MKRYFDVGVKDRPYMLTRMPRFGAENLGALGEAFASLDPLEPVEVPTFDESARRVKSAGRFLAGGEALGCIKCHNFKGIAAEGVQAVDMTVMTRRLRHDWFHRYLVDTQAYRPGTRMPTAWPGGKTMLPQVLDGDTRKQIEALWLFLADGRDAVEPYGLGREPMPLVPEGEAIIYRNFLRGAGPRAIGVGYPEQREPGLRRQRPADRPDLARGLHRRLAALVGPRRRLPGPPRQQRHRAARGAELRHALERRRALARRPGEGAGRRLPRLPADEGQPADVPL